MKALLIAATLLAGGLAGSSTPTHAHGGTYRGPGDTVPPGAGGGGGGGAGPASGPTGPSSGGPNGPVTGAPGGPGGPGGAGGGPGTGAGADGGQDLTDWAFWWEFNKDPYLNLKAKVHEDAIVTGMEGFYLGHGSARQGKDRFKPTDAQVRGEIVPALIEALGSETNNDIVTGCLIALAKIGDVPGETGESRFEPILARFLADKNQEIRETAAVALGILANPRSIETLQHLLTDSPKGRALVGQPEVDHRTSSFAAYGLGLIGNLAGREEDRRKIVSILRGAIEGGATRSRDLRVAGVIAMGLVALETIESVERREAKGSPPPESSRVAQLEFLLALLRDGEQDHLVRAHCPTALARLLPGLPPELHESYRHELAEELLERLQPKANEQVEVVQSSAQALGLIGTNDAADELDVRIREALAGELKDASARHFALISLAKIGGRTADGARDAEGGRARVLEVLQARLAKGKGSVKAWAGLACGVMASELVASDDTLTTLEALQRGVRLGLEEHAKDPSRLGAFAVAAGIMGDVEAKAWLIEQLDAQRDETALGYVCVGLGLMNAREALEKLNRIVADSRYKPEILKQSSIALGLMGDKEVVPRLIALLEGSRGLATQAALARALGIIGDHRSITPLVTMLKNEDLTDGARGFAAVALGLVADKEALPWNSKIALDLNYRASTPTLTSQASGTGILDLL